MSKCLNCKVEILDEAECCPLCGSVLLYTEAMENMYPDLRRPARKMALVVNIYLFSAIVLECLLIALNIGLGHKLWWSLIVGLGLLYGYIVLRYGVQGRGGYQAKTIVLTALAVLSAVSVDFLIGYRGWSVSYALPAGIVFIDAAILVLIFVNRRNWQSYIIHEIMMLLCSLIPVGLYLAGGRCNPFIAFMPLVISALLFLGTLIIGDAKARQELKRRFHF